MRWRFWQNPRIFLFGQKLHSSKVTLAAWKQKHHAWRHHVPSRVHTQLCHSLLSARSVLSAGLPLVCVCSHWFISNLLKCYCGNSGGAARPAPPPQRISLSLSLFMCSASATLPSAPRVAFSPHLRLILLLFFHLFHVHILLDVLSACNFCYFAASPLNLLTAEG